VETRVLLTTDGSTDATAAIDWLSRLPLSGARLRVLTVVTLPPSSIDLPTVRAYYQELLDNGERIVAAGREALRARYSGGARSRAVPALAPRQRLGAGCPPRRLPGARGSAARGEARRVVKNAEIARNFALMADVLEIRGAIPFRIRAYRCAMRS
jgi:hypothetical protein